jgi:hypothetical protein
MSFGNDDGANKRNGSGRSALLGLSHCYEPTSYAARRSHDQTLAMARTNQTSTASGASGAGPEFKVRVFKILV